MGPAPEIFTRTAVWAPSRAGRAFLPLVPRGVGKPLVTSCQAGAHCLACMCVSFISNVVLLPQGRAEHSLERKLQNKASRQAVLLTWGGMNLVALSF